MDATETNMPKDTKINLRNLDDIDCANVVVTRQIKKFVKKFPNMREAAMECWTNSDHYTKFKLSDNGSIHWISVETEYPHRQSVLHANDRDLDREDLNKLLVYTYRTMCDCNDGIDLIDTTEDLLAFAESKLKALLSEEAEATEEQSIYLLFNAE